MSSVDLLGKAKLVLPVAKTINGQLKVPEKHNRTAEHLAIRKINISISDDIEKMELDVLLQYGNVVDGQFRGLDIANDTFELHIPIEQSEALATPISPSERSMDLKTIVYVRIMGYLKYTGYIQ